LLKGRAVQMRGTDEEDFKGNLGLGPINRIPISAEV
jgi:hypothetical protein